MAVWRESGDGRRLALRITDAGLAAIGIEPGPAVQPQPQPDPEPIGAEASEGASTQKAAPSGSASA